MTDPRFDPAFQRGYDGPNPELVARKRPAESAPGSATPEAAAASEQVDIPGQLPDPLAGPPTELLPDPIAPAARNPYRLALLLFGFVLLIAAASTLYWQVLHPQATSTTVESQFVQALVSNLPPSLALAGLVCMIVWLALGALDRVTPAPAGSED